MIVFLELDTFLIFLIGVPGKGKDLTSELPPNMKAHSFIEQNFLFHAILFLLCNICNTAHEQYSDTTLAHPCPQNIIGFNFNVTFPYVHPLHQRHPVLFCQKRRNSQTL